LSSPQTLARLSPDGTIAERVSLPVPWTELFGVGDRLLLEQVPRGPGSLLFATASPRRPQDLRPWRGVISRTAATAVEMLTANLVRCGLAGGGQVPCWFPDESTITFSDGIHSVRASFDWIRTLDISRTMPLRDVAYVNRQRVWLLPTSKRLDQGRRVATRLLLATRTGRELTRLDLNVPVRLILSATELSCVLLTAGGDVTEVRER
jgi:hypothetical protein